MNVARNELPAFAEGVLKKIEQKTGAAFLIFLLGNLGSGKTTFMQAFARSLGVGEVVQSPTFVLMKKYALAENSRGPSGPKGPSLKPASTDGSLRPQPFSTLIHIDAYRLEDPKEFAALRPEEFLQAPQNIVCIEWAENVSGALPEPDLILKFSSEGMGEGEREIEILTN